jgi:hypothetical protein
MTYVLKPGLPYRRQTRKKSQNPILNQLNDKGWKWIQI